MLFGGGFVDTATAQHPSSIMQRVRAPTSVLSNTLQTGRSACVDRTSGVREWL